MKQGVHVMVVGLYRIMLGFVAVFCRVPVRFAHRWCELLNARCLSSISPECYISLCRYKVSFDQSCVQGIAG